MLKRVSVLFYMNILSIETSTESCSAAFCTEKKLLVRHQVAPREHSKLLLKMVDELLKEANLSISQVDAFAYGMGPGSFTGLRIATSIVQGLSYGTHKQVIPISTLQALAQAAWRRFGYTKVFAALDARMDEIYYGFYALDNDDIMQNIDTDRLSSPKYFDSLPQNVAANKWQGVGSGMVVYHELLQQSLPCVTMQEALMYPSALEIAIIANSIYSKDGGKSPTSAIPVYLRNKVTEKPSNTIEGAVFKK